MPRTPNPFLDSMVVSPLRRAGWVVSTQQMNEMISWHDTLKTTQLGIPVVQSASLVNNQIKNR